MAKPIDKEYLKKALKNFDEEILGNKYLQEKDTKVQADWNETDTASEAFIKNKPEIVSEERVTALENPTFTEATTRANIASGDSSPTILGKIKKYFSDLKSHAFNTPANNLTTVDEGYALDARQGKVLQEKIGSTDISAIGDGTLTNAISIIRSNLSNYINDDITDANTRFNGVAYNNNNSIANCPYVHGLLCSTTSSVVGFQLFFGYPNMGLWFRDMVNNSTNDWIKISSKTDVDNKVFGQTNNAVKIGQFIGLDSNPVNVYEYYIYVPSDQFPKTEQTGVEVQSEISLGDMSEVLRLANSGNIVEMTGLFYIPGSFCAPMVSGEAGNHVKYYIGPTGNLCIKNSFAEYNGCSAIVKIRYMRTQ